MTGLREQPEGSTDVITYLVALDTSPVAVDVLTAARDLAQKTHARLLLVRAVGLPTNIPEEGFAVSPASVVNLLVGTARRNLEAKLEDLPAELQAEAVVEVGPAWRVICSLAKAREADLIIVGAHGHRILDRVLGTTTQQVVSHADRSVLVIRPHPRTAELHHLESLKGQSVT